jgi:hypothetical protein
MSDGRRVTAGSFAGLQTHQFSGTVRNRATRCLVGVELACWFRNAWDAERKSGHLAFRIAFDKKVQTERTGGLVAADGPLDHSASRSGSDCSFRQTGFSDRNQWSVERA